MQEPNGSRFCPINAVNSGTLECVYSVRRVELMMKNLMAFVTGKVSAIGGHLRGNVDRSGLVVYPTEIE